MVEPPAGYRSRRERLGERTDDLGLGDGSTPIHDSSPRAASARMALTAGARRRLRRRDRMHPDCYCPARRLPSFPMGAVLGMSGSDPPKAKWTDAHFRHACREQGRTSSDEPFVTNPS